MRNDSQISFDKKISKNTLPKIDSTSPKVVLVGNPNVGKSCVFNYLSGMYVDVSNFPGTTVSLTKCVYDGKEIYDTPGIYGVSSFNEEERVARDIIFKSDIVINVINALNLERDLFLTLQLIDMGKRVVVLLNFNDELKKHKIKIETQKFADLLGVEVIPTSAVSNEGLDKIKSAINNAKIGIKQESVENLIATLMPYSIPRDEALLILEGDEEVAKKNNVAPGTSHEREILYIGRRVRVNEIVDQVQHEDSKRGELVNLLGRITLNPLTGIPFLLGILFIVYLFVGDLVSQRVVDFTENTVGVGIFEYNVKSFVANYTSTEISVSIEDKNEDVIEEKVFSFPAGMEKDPTLKKSFNDFSQLPGAVSTFVFEKPIARLFFGEFGVITMTITYLICLLLPLVIAFFIVMAILEDTGYLPRLATMLDRAFNKIGLNGKAVIPIMLGFGCITMANITTRMLGTERERSIVTAILQFVIPCSAQLAVIAALLSGTGIKALLLYVFVIGSVLIILSTILNKLLAGESSPLLLDLPIMRLPRLDNLLKKTFYRSWGFMKEAGVWFFVGALGVGILDITGLLIVWQNALEPFTTMWLKLPKEAANAFVMGIVRRDFGAAGLFHLELSAMQKTVSIITITLFVPCIASFVVMLKERGVKEGMLIWAGTWISAFLIGGIIAQIVI